MWSLPRFALLTLCFFPAAAVAQPVSTVDLADVSPADGLLRRVLGATGTGIFGVPVAGGADVDGDGLVDYAVAYMTADPLGRSRAGEVDLVFGDGTVRGTIDTALPDPAVLRIFGTHTQEYAGSEIWIDDVTGDGVGDLLICRQNFTPGPDRIGAGALTIVAGGAALRQRAAALEPLDLAAPPPGIVLTTLIGARELDRLGIWTRTGDVDGDGIRDVLVGADQEDLGGETNRGAAYLIRGGPHLASGATIDLADFAATAADTAAGGRKSPLAPLFQRGGPEKTLAGNVAKIVPPPGSAGFHLGATCQIADLDGNGRGEVLLAAALNRAGASLRAPGAPPGSAEGQGGAPNGRLYIAWDGNFPDAPWPAGFTVDLGAPPDDVTVIRGEDGNRVFGEEILGGFDLDRDGRADLFAGDLTGDGTANRLRSTSGLGHVFFDAARLKGLDVDLDAPPAELAITRILGPSIGAIGADTAAAGDFNRDGTSDLAFTSPHGAPEGRHTAGEIHVLFGRTGGWPATIDLAPGALPPPETVRIAHVLGARGTVGSDTGDTLGYSAAAGDVDGDGHTDLIVNEMVGNGATPAAEDVGNLIVLSGRALSVPAIFADGFESGDLGRWTLFLAMTALDEPR